MAPAPRLLPTRLDRPARMVSWFNPVQLVASGAQVVVSTLFGSHADRRLLEALATPSAAPFDFTREEDGQPIDEIWIDFIADTGDGWNSTYSVAYVSGLPELTLRDSSGTLHRTERGRVLVFGGDEIYPSPSRALYKQKLVAPFEAALKWTDPPYAQAFAIPGNHDWYDSLVAFTRLFCSRDWLGGRQTPQTRSYFALKLPHGWWLIGTDVQLGSDLDAPQVEFFKSVRKQMEEGDRVILCTAEPHWIYSHLYSRYDATVYNESNLEFLERTVFGSAKPESSRVPVFLSGDLHHYRRHARPDGRQKITAGGGGAFLHPTHGPKVDELEGGYVLRKSFPDQKTSAKLCWRNLLFPVFNPLFGLVPAVLYLLVSWTTLSDIGAYGAHQIGTALGTVLKDALRKPSAAFWIVGIIMAFVLFTETHSRVYRWIAGPLHGLVHLGAVFLLGWGAAFYCSSRQLVFGTPPYLWRCGVAVFAGGWIVGSLIMGAYLLVSLNVFRRHSDEALAALKISDWKNFLRLRIDARGDLTVFPVGIRFVSRRWKRAREGAQPEQIPDDARFTGAELIEDPIVVGRPASASRSAP